MTRRQPAPDPNVALRLLAERVEREHRPTWHPAEGGIDSPPDPAQWLCHACAGCVDAESPEPESGRDAIEHDEDCIWVQAHEALDALDEEARRG